MVMFVIKTITFVKHLAQLLVHGGCLYILLGGSRGVDGHSWGDPYLKRRLRHVSEMPPYFSDFCLFLELCGYSANELVSKLADGEKQQG